MEKVRDFTLKNYGKDVIPQILMEILSTSQTFEMISQTKSVLSFGETTVCVLSTSVGANEQYQMA